MIEDTVTVNEEESVVNAENVGESDEEYKKPKVGLDKFRDSGM